MEANSRASASSTVSVETVSSLAQPTFTYYTLGALSGHVVNIVMVYNDSVFTVLNQSNHPCGCYHIVGESVPVSGCIRSVCVCVYIHTCNYT